MKLNVMLLRLLLIVVAVTGLPCSGSLLVSWESAAAVVKQMGIEGVPETLVPIIEYWLRMMAVLRVLVGVFYLVAATNPLKYRNILPILGGGMLFMGSMAAYHGVRLHLGAWSFYSDVGICGVCGVGILWLWARLDGGDCNASGRS